MQIEVGHFFFTLFVRVGSGVQIEVSIFFPTTGIFFTRVLFLFSPAHTSCNPHAYIRATWVAKKAHTLLRPQTAQDSAALDNMSLGPRRNVLHRTSAFRSLDLECCAPRARAAADALLDAEGLPRTPPPAPRAKRANQRASPVLQRPRPPAIVIGTCRGNCVCDTV